MAGDYIQVPADNSVGDYRVYSNSTCTTTTSDSSITISGDTSTWYDGTYMGSSDGTPWTDIPIHPAIDVQIDWDKIEKLQFKVGKKIITITKDQLVKGVFGRYRGLAKKFAEARFEEEPLGAL